MSKWVAPLLDFGLAWRLLTVVPLPLIPDVTERPAGRAAAYFPLVGAILGLGLAGAAWLARGWLPEPVGAALLLALWAGLTGLLHLDGFMDSYDGLLPPRDPARRLEIMKDSRVGAFGVVGVILLLLVKYSALLVLVGGESGPVSKTGPLFQTGPLLIIIPTLARWGMVWQMGRYPLARREGIAVFFRQGLGWPQMALASLLAGSVTALAGWWGLLLLAATALTTIGLARLALARLGGLTGDIYGATCEVVEVLLLVVAVG